MMPQWVAWQVREYADFCAEHGLGPALGEAVRAQPPGQGADAARVAFSPGPGMPEQLVAEPRQSAATRSLREAILLRHAASRARLGLRIAGPAYRFILDAGLLGSEAYLLGRVEVMGVGGEWHSSDRLWSVALPTTALPTVLPEIVAACGEDVGVSVLGNRDPWFLIRSHGRWGLPSGSDADLVDVAPGTVSGLFAGAVADAIAGGLPPVAAERGAA